MDEAAEENEADTDQPLPGRVKSLITKLESAIGQDQLKEIPIRNGIPVYPTISSSLFEGDDGDGKTKDATEQKEQDLDTQSTDDKSSRVGRSLSWLSSLRKPKNKAVNTRKSSRFYSSSSPDKEEDGKSPRPLSETDLLVVIPADRNDCSSETSGNSCIDLAAIDTDGESNQNVEVAGAIMASPSQKAYLKANEMMTSEESYAKTIRLLNVKFRNHIEYINYHSKTKVIPDADLKNILNYLQELQSLSENILDDFKSRLANWGDNPKIADVLVKKGPFLKMYSTYSINFEAQTKFFHECCSKYLNFAKLVKEFEVEHCNKLTLNSCMLKPIQRIPQYRLLLTDYLKYLDVTSPDYEDTLIALRTVTDVADHVNESMKHGDKVERLIQLQTMLGDFQLIEPGRELIKDGILQKCSRKINHERHFILLNDCLVYTTPSKSLPPPLPLDGMKVSEHIDDTNRYTFAVYSRTKSFILCAKSESERKDWIIAFQKAIDDFASRKKTFLLGSLPVQSDNFKLGKDAPIWIPDNKVTMCQVCIEDFTHLFRRHHCRACGKVTCSKCSSNQAPLQYKHFKSERVCDECYHILLEEFDEQKEAIKRSLPGSTEEAKENAYQDIREKFVRSSTRDNTKHKKLIPTRLTEVTAVDAQACVSGWLRYYKPPKWKEEKNWYVLKDRVLYVYNASQDVAATHTIPVLGYHVHNGCIEATYVKPELMFQLVHPNRPPMIFSAETAEAAKRWFEKLDTASKFDSL